MTKQQHPTPIKPTEILDPNPERLTRITGVRPYNPTTPPQNRKVEMIPAASDHLLFVDNPPAVPSALGKRWLIPWASTALYTLGQLILAVTIATGDTRPSIGIAVCTAWTVCGGLLIAAQMMSQARTHDADRRISDV